MRSAPRDLIARARQIELGGGIDQRMLGDQIAARRDATVDSPWRRPRAPPRAGPAWSRSRRERRRSRAGSRAAPAAGGRAPPRARPPRRPPAASSPPKRGPSSPISPVEPHARDAQRAHAPLPEIRERVVGVDRVDRELVLRARAQPAQLEPAGVEAGDLDRSGRDAALRELPQRPPVRERAPLRPGRGARQRERGEQRERCDQAAAQGARCHDTPGGSLAGYRAAPRPGRVRSRSRSRRRAVARRREHQRAPRQAEGPEALLGQLGLEPLAGLGDQLDLHARARPRGCARRARAARRAVRRAMARSRAGAAARRPAPARPRRGRGRRSRRRGTRRRSGVAGSW